MYGAVSAATNMGGADEQLLSGADSQAPSPTVPGDGAGPAEYAGASSQAVATPKVDPAPMRGGIAAATQLHTGAVSAVQTKL